jgi:hypothetical protein
MARPLRIERAGGWYHVTARGNERRPVYRDDRDRRHFRGLLGEAVVRFRWRIHAYALMGRLVGGLEYRTVGWAVKRMAQRCEQDPELARVRQRVSAQIQNPEI